MKIQEKGRERRRVVRNILKIDEMVLKKFKKINLRANSLAERNKGLISVDRNNKVTRRLTIPCSMFKSSAKDLSLEIFGFTM